MSLSFIIVGFFIFAFWALYLATKKDAEQPNATPAQVQSNIGGIYAGAFFLTLLTLSFLSIH